MVWKDSTSYSRGETNRVPRVWDTQFGQFRVTVHRYHGLEGWFLSTQNPDLFDRHELRSEDIEDAKEEAISAIKIRLAVLLEAVKKDQ